MFIHPFIVSNLKPAVAHTQVPGLRAAAMPPARPLRGGAVVVCFVMSAFWGLRVCLVFVKTADQ